jgi:hypothetical protein
MSLLLLHSHKRQDNKSILFLFFFYTHINIKTTNYHHRSDRDGLAQERQELTVTVSELQAKIAHDAEVCARPIYTSTPLIFFESTYHV